MFKKVVSVITVGVLATGILPGGIVLATTEYGSEKLSPQAYSNAQKFYFEGSGGKFATNNKLISAEDFMTKDGWKNEWKPIKEWTGDSETNILTLNGVDYEITLPKPSVSTVYSGFETPLATTDIYTNVDIPDGIYSGISFLGGADSYGDVNQGVIRFNYTDNTSSGWIEYEQNKVSEEGSNCIKVAAKKFSFGNISDADYLYLHQINVLTDSSKTMASFDIGARNTALEGDTLTVKGTSGAAAYKYSSRYVAMTMLKDKSQSERAKIKEIKEIIDTLPAVDDFSYTDENIEKLYKIREIRESVDESVIKDENDKSVLAGADKYIALLTQVDIKKNNEKIDNLGKMLEDLPVLDELTIADEEKLSEINEALKEVDLTLEIPAEQQKILDNIEEYNKKITELKIAENDKVAEEIKALTENLPAIEEFEKPETYNDEVLDVLVEIKTLLDKIDENGVSEENKAVIETAKEYAAKIEYYDILNNAALIEEIEVILKTLPQIESFEYTRENEEVLGNLSNLCDKVLTEKLTQEQKESFDAAKEYVALLKNFPPVSKTLNPDMFVNYNRTYYNEFGGAGICNNHGITWSEFIKRPEWKNSWTSADVEDNIFVTEKAEYLIRLDKGTGKNNAYSPKAGTTIGYDTLDIDDGKYTKMMMLGAGTCHGSSYAGLQFNYEDGTNSGFISQSLGGNLTVKKEGAIELEGKHSTQQSNGTWVYENMKVYLKEYEFENPNPEKVVVSVSIPYRNVTIKNGVLTPMAVTSGGGTYAYDIRWIGMTLLQTSNEYKNIISDKFMALKDVKEENAKAALASVDEIVQNAVMMGMNISNIEGYEIYQALSEKYVRIFGYEESVDLKNVTVSVRFASDVEIEKSDVTLLKGDKEQKFEFIYEDSVAKVTFKNTFDYTSEFSLKLNKDISSRVESTSILGSEAVHSFTVPAVVAFSDFSVTEGENEAMVSFTLSNNLMEKQDALVTVCVMDKQGRMIDSGMVKAKDIEKGNSLTGEMTLNTVSGYTLKVFVIDNINNMNTIYKYNY